MANMDYHENPEMKTLGEAIADLGDKHGLRVVAVILGVDEEKSLDVHLASNTGAIEVTSALAIGLSQAWECFDRLAEGETIDRAKIETMMTALNYFLGRMGYERRMAG